MQIARIRFGVCAAGALLVAGTAPAQAELSATVTAATDYDFRGITQTALDPAIQLGIDWAHENGIYAGLWGSNLDFGDGAEGSDVEVDLILGYSASVTEGVDFDVGATYYLYLPDDDDIDYLELYAGLSQEIFSGKLWYSPDYGNSGDSAWYLDGNASFPLPREFALNLHLGYNAGDYWDDAENGVDEFFDYSIGIGRSFGRFDFELKWIDGSDLKEADGTPDDVFSSESKVFFSVATTFPWSDAE